MRSRSLEFRGSVASQYADVLTPEAVAALDALAAFDADRRAVMAARIARRAARAGNRQRIAFLDPAATIPRTSVTVAQARRGDFVGSEIPRDLRRQWIQGTSPAAKPNSPVGKSIRNVAHALLSGADGWMFDGEDALGQVSTMSLDNQRNLKLAMHRDPVFMKAAEEVAGEMNRGVRRSPAARRSRTGRRSSTSRRRFPSARPSPRRPPHPPHGRRRILGLHRRHHAVRGQQPPCTP